MLMQVTEVAQVTEAAQVQADIEALNDYTGPAWKVESMSKILGDIEAKRPKANIYVHHTNQDLNDHTVEDIGGWVTPAEDDQVMSGLTDE